MKPEHIGYALFGLFGAGIFLVALGLGLTTRLAALGVGLVLSFAAVQFLAGGPRR